MIKNINYDKNYEHILKLLGQLVEDNLGEDISNIGEFSKDKKLDKKISLGYFEDSISLGGIIGVIDSAFGTLKIEYLAVEKEARGKNVGKELVESIEEIAKLEGCNFSFVETVNFSAPNFYKKIGYQLMYELENYPMKGITNYFFYKNLL